jgi:L-serine dehydratase
MKDTWSVFDIIGPVMVGPSSSHTAGACKLGYMARIIFGKKPQKAVLKLHGSFGEVYAGHCTDVALIGGLLGMLPSNPDIKNAYELAEKQGMEIEIISSNLGAKYHPNTVHFVLTYDDFTMNIVGSSIGGGKVVISEIDKVEVELTGSYSSLLVCYDNKILNISDIMKISAEKELSIVKMDTMQYKDRSIIDIAIKEWFERDIIFEIEKVPGVHWARFVNHISHFTEVGMS